MIVFPDADIAGVVDWMLTGILWGSGQVCSATSRVLLHRSIRAPVMARLLQCLAAVKMGDSLSAEMLAHQGPCMGPVVSEGQFNRVWEYIDGARAEGLVFAYGGDRAALAAHALPAGGFYVPPTVIVDAPTSSRVWKDEIFGPVLCIRVRV